MRERISFDPFVLPFTLGLIFFLTYFLVWIIRILSELKPEERRTLGKSLFGPKIGSSLKEIFLECLFHRKIWMKNPMLGYMHSSIAFGWFMLILLGHIEVWLYVPHRTNLYYPIFFRYFVMQTDETLRGALFFFLMDFFLLMVLSGVFLAMYKRINSRFLGMRRTTRHSLGDTLAMYSLWFIFPMRLFAESFTSDIGGGSFLTRGFGLLIESFASDDALILPSWWGYSLSLGIFMVALPFSRYMHIPTEVVLILLRNAGIRSERSQTGYARAETLACSRCGICIDPCQMGSAARMNGSTSVYFMRKLRGKKPEAQISANECMMCMRCVEACPVGIDSCRLKQALRTEKSFPENFNHAYLPEFDSPKTEVLYFAGCMGHLTPAVPKAMTTILKTAGISFRFMDKDGSICCGRPLILAGGIRAAQSVIEANRTLIEKSEASVLVTSCPICYRVFREEYGLNIRVLHHTEYLEELLQKNAIQIFKKPLKVVYHDPCELGRGSGVYEPPRKVLEQVVQLLPSPDHREKALCCGGSIGSLTLDLKRRRKITRDAWTRLTVNQPDLLITACPLCQKTFSSHQGNKVQDIAQIVAGALHREE